MAHRILTCKNHPELRWSTKAEAWSTYEGRGFYNGSRSIFYNGTPLKNEDGSPKMFRDKSGLDCSTHTGGVAYPECSCSSKDLILAPEDDLVMEQVRDPETGAWIWAPAHWVKKEVSK